MADEWAGATAVIVGSGPSAPHINLLPAHGVARIIAVNNSWRLCPWADVLYGCDASWWFHNKGVPEFTGLRYASSPVACARFGLVLFTTTGSNSGIRAIRLAELFGSRRILLVGFDMHVLDGAHWHPPHGGPCRDPNVNSTIGWRAEFDRDVKNKRFKATIINCTPGSALTCFPCEEFITALDGGNGQARSDREGHCDHIA